MRMRRQSQKVVCLSAGVRRFSGLGGKRGQIYFLLSFNNREVRGQFSHSNISSGRRGRSRWRPQRR